MKTTLRNVLMLACMLMTSLLVRAEPWKQIGGWVISCQTDAITDRRSCLAFREGLAISYDHNESTGVMIAPENKMYPGTEIFVRIDQDILLSTQRKGWFETDARGIIQLFLRGKQVRTRYTSWPYKTHVDNEISLKGFADVWAYLQTHAKKSVAAK